MRFALISEGITDQVVIESIIGAYYKNSTEEVIVNPLQPMRDATDQSRQAIDSFGGWEQVFEYISIDENCASALDANDKLIIQIDSDICRHPSINIDPHMDQKTLFTTLRDLLISKMPAEILEWIQDDLIFAIPIHSTECWLIPRYTKNQITLKKLNNCEDVLNKIDKKVLKKMAEVKEVEKTFDCYKKLSARIKKLEDIELISKHNESLTLFTNQLPVINDKSESPQEVNN